MGFYFGDLQDVWGCLQVQGEKKNLVSRDILGSFEFSGSRVFSAFLLEMHISLPRFTHMERKKSGSACRALKLLSSIYLPEMRSSLTMDVLSVMFGAVKGWTCSSCVTLFKPSLPSMKGLHSLPRRGLRKVRLSDPSAFLPR